MPRYGLFEAGSNRVLPKYEGDRMVQGGEFVRITKKETESETPRQVAAIRLDRGQSIREIPEVEAAHR